MRALAALACLLLAGCFAVPAQDSHAPAVHAGSSSSPASSSSPSTAQPPPPSAPVENATSLELWVVDIGQGAALVLQAANRTMLVDSADRSANSTSALLAFLEAHHIAVVDDWLQTQADADHSGACREVFLATRVLEFYHPGSPKDTMTWRECLEAAAAEGMPIHTDADLNAGDLIDWAPGVQVTVLNVDQTSETINEGSLAVWVRLGDMDVVLPSDIGCATEEKVLARFPLLKAEVLQAGHHGSAYSTCAPWL